MIAMQLYNPADLWIIIILIYCGFTSLFVVFDIYEKQIIEKSKLVLGGHLSHARLALHLIWHFLCALCF